MLVGADDECISIQNEISFVPPVLSFYNITTDNTEFSYFTMNCPAFDVNKKIKKKDIKQNSVLCVCVWTYDTFHPSTPAMMR